jgi:hypothetical protein
VAIGLNPKYGLAYYARGNAYHDKGDSGRATADYTEANKLGIKPDAPFARPLQSDWQRAGIIADVC